MKIQFKLIMLVSLTFVKLYTQTPCDCSPTTKIEHQQRTSAKHESNYSKFPNKKDTITVDYIYNWEDNYSDKTQNIKTNPSNPMSERCKETPEDTLYILTGNMWFVKQEANDCDFHIEIGTDNPEDTRIIVEVEKENCELQKKIKEYLDSKGLKITNLTGNNAAKDHFNEGIPCIVTGLGFYDASHKSNTNHGDKHTKKYTWELHPVKEIVFK